MNTDNKNNLREGFHHVEILLDNKPESIKKIYLPLERSDDRIEKLLEKCGNIGLKVEFSKKLNKLVKADIICTHAPPYIDELMTDVVTNKIEQGWKSLLDFIKTNHPKFALFGDVHQPKASTWIVNNTKCINTGYFRATNQYLELSSII